MAEGSAVHRPIPLRAILDAGCDLVEAVGERALRILAGDVFTRIPLLPAQERARQAAQLRENIDHRVEFGAEAAPLDMQFLTTYEAWEADLLEDPALVERLQRALPPAIVEEFGPQLDEYRRPHPVEVRMVDRWWNCHSCGAAFDQGQQEAVVVTYREGHSHLDYEIEYCGACITVAAEVARLANGS